MSNLRSIVTSHVEEETLKAYYKSKYTSTPGREKKKTLDFLKENGAIDREVDKILRAFSEEILEGSPDVKKRKLRSVIYNIIILVCTIGIAYAVNVEGWVFVVIIALIQAITQYVSIRE